MNDIRFGIVGIGNIGTLHKNYLCNGEIENARLTCVCDIDKSKLENVKKQNTEIECFDDYHDMMTSGLIDAVIIATPHYLHPEMAIFAFQNGLNVIVEKPVGVFTKDVLQMNEVAKRSGKVFSSMFCVRTDPCFQKIRQLVSNGELGDIKRINWIATNWYRPQAYHNSSSWRSSWKGEGGGVLVNQSPHNLDMIQWIFGMPKKVTAFASFGKYYDIEVEDEVTAVLHYDNFDFVYIASTGEAPGSNRLEIACDMGRLLFENSKIQFKKNEMSERDFNRITKAIMDMPKCEEIEILPNEGAMKHQNITQNFVNAILFNEELIAPGLNGINEVMISNAIHMSAWTGKTVELPLDSEEFYKMLQDKISESDK